MEGGYVQIQAVGRDASTDGRERSGVGVMLPSFDEMMKFSSIIAALMMK